MKIFQISIIFIILFSTSKSFAQDSGSFVDPRDNREYYWVRIGFQTWMAENLAFLPSVTPAATGIKSDKGYFVYDYNGTSVNNAKQTNTFKTYGVLYNWNAAKTACPPGWHLPVYMEWEQLAQFVVSQHGGVYSLQGYWTVIGKVLKAAGTTEASNGFWVFDTNMNTGTNLLEFSGLPGGRFTNGGFGSLGKIGIWWSAEEFDKNAANTFVLNYSSTLFFNNSYNKKDGLSVRCIKD